ncbi:MAG: DUF4197 domain-containing protein [Bacteroidales bacterium]|jgi:hypothetical protein|nr:DUF4197 domain-containing protein [Bacteroidales bacterium]
MKRHIFYGLAFVLSTHLFCSCDGLLPQPSTLSQEDIVTGLKTALKIGVDTATNRLSANGGYYNNLATRIPLPDEANTILKNVEEITSNPIIASLVPNLKSDIQAKVTSLVQSINSSASEAAKDAAPIFSDAITNLTIADGLSILQGQTVLKSGEFDSLAATNYLKSQTFVNLTDLYAPKMNIALGKPLVGNISASDLWNSITSTYNNAAKKVNVASSLTGKTFELVDTDLGEFVTTKALTGLFNKVGEQEKQIRRNPFQYVSDIVQKVFGYVFK